MRRIAPAPWHSSCIVFDLTVETERRVHCPLASRKTNHRSAGPAALRNHIVGQCVTRLRATSGARWDGWISRKVPQVRPANLLHKETLT